MSLTVQEVFSSIQGEGLLTGQTTTFFRFGGCPLRCGWCDSLKAVDKPLVGQKQWDVMDVQTLLGVYESLYLKTRAVCFSGGEPFMQPCDELAWLTAHFQYLDKMVTVETAGTIWDEKLVEALDWITVSPKLPSAGQGEAGMNYEVIEKFMGAASRRMQFKFVVADAGDIEALMQFVAKYDAAFKKGLPLIINAVNNNFAITRKMISMGVSPDYNVRYMLQAHKAFGLR